MKYVNKLVNLHYIDNNKQKKISFQTVYDDIDHTIEYSIIDNDGRRIVSKEEGNEYFRKLRKMHPQSKAIVIIDKEERKVQYKQVNGHYEIYVDGIRQSTCDDYDEVRKEIEQLKRGFERC